MPESEWYTLISMIVFVAVFGVISLIGFMLFLRARGDRKRAISRLRELGENGPAAIAEPAAPAEGWLGAHLPKLGTMLFGGKDTRLSPLQRQLLYAGFYRQGAAGLVLGAKVALMVLLPLLAAGLPYLLGHLTWPRAIMLSVTASAIGMIIPGLWLDAQVRKRQRALRNGLPDALDMIVMCLEGGITMTAAFQRVARELQVVHPILGAELNIVQREVHMGLSIGESLKKLAERCGLDDVRELASVLLQSERYGASAAKTLRTHAETWRQERQMRIEEQAQKAAVKILFPTLLCIFPAIFIVLLGPAAFQMAALFAK